MRGFLAMNELGAIILVLSGAMVIFAILTALLGLGLPLERSLLRLVSLEIFDNRRETRTTAKIYGRGALSHRFARAVLGVWRPAKLALLRWSGIGSQAMALELSRRAFYVNLSLASLALIVLGVLMWTGDMTNRYVVSNTSQDLESFYRITAVWAGSSGSLLFWYFLLALFSAIVVYQTRTKLYNRLPVLFLVLGTLQLCFVLLNLFFRDAQPFRTFEVEMVSGRGLNPLLLHWAMIIHPPILYVGYVSFAIPFAICMAAVISGNLRSDWLPLIRRWTIFSWFFLGFGILLGSKWAYEELGWGGYWAWDPVENASLMPWLLATAFLHSLLVQERRGLLRFWNVILITATYHMCLLGTWITRSGILQGPHTFAESTIGTPLIVYISLSFFFYIRYVYFRRPALKPAHQMEYVTSKEGSMLLNNLLMALAMFIVLVGVFSPLLPMDCGFGPEGFACNKVEWKQSAYNKIMVPLGLLTLFLMGASPLLSWRKPAWEVWKKTLRVPILAGVVGGVIFALSYGALFTRSAGPDHSTWGPGIIAELFSILTMGIAIFVIVGLGQEYWQGMRSRMLRFEENAIVALVRLILRNKRRYAGYLMHLSMVFLFVGYAGGTFKKTEKFEFHYYKMQWPGADGDDVVRYSSPDKAYLEDYEIAAGDLYLRPEFKDNADPANPVHFTISQEAHFHIQHGTGLRDDTARPEGVSPFAFANRPQPPYAQALKTLTGFIVDGRMRTERQFHPQINPVTGTVARSQDSRARHTPTSEPDIRSTWTEDIYIQLGAISSGNPEIPNPDLNHAYEFYYHQTDRGPRAYAALFPPALIATLEVWINPLVKFVWLGTLLFFLGGLVLLIPIGERELG